MRVRVRLPPSPTGPLHVGTARTALFNFLYARQQGGQFILRIEDTDAERSRPEYEQEMLEGLRWLGLTWDEGPDVGGPHAPYRQSERSALYAEAVERLLQEERGYEREGAVYLRVARSAPVVVHDLIHGAVLFPAKELEDFVIAKPLAMSGQGSYAPRSPASRRDGVGWAALYHLAVVVDDAVMAITHVIRGDDHLSNTPKHLLLQEALGLPTPLYAHVPLLLDADRKKLSKRAMASGRMLDVRLLAYRDRGYLPEAMVNFLALLGWNPKTDQEVFTLDELVRQFDLAGVQKGGAVFDSRKLEWLQRQHLPRIELRVLRDREPYKSSLDVSPVLNPEHTLEVWREHGFLHDSLRDIINIEAEPPALVRTDIPWRGVSEDKTRDALRFAEQMIMELADTAWETRSGLQNAVRDAVDSAGWDRGTVLWPLRYALTGRRESAGPGEIAWLLGKEETLHRIAKAQDLLK